MSRQYGQAPWPSSSSSGSPSASSPTSISPPPVRDFRKSSSPLMQEGPVFTRQPAGSNSLSSAASYRSEYSHGSRAASVASSSSRTGKPPSSNSSSSTPRQPSSPPLPSSHLSASSSDQTNSDVGLNFFPSVPTSAASSSRQASQPQLYPQGSIPPRTFSSLPSASGGRSSALSHTTSSSIGSSAGLVAAPRQPYASRTIPFPVTTSSTLSGASVAPAPFTNVSGANNSQTGLTMSPRAMSPSTAGDQDPLPGAFYRSSDRERAAASPTVSTFSQRSQSSAFSGQMTPTGSSSGSGSKVVSVPLRGAGTGVNVRVRGGTGQSGQSKNGSASQASVKSRMSSQLLDSDSEASGTMHSAASSSYDHDNDFLPSRSESPFPASAASYARHAHTNSSSSYASVPASASGSVSSSSGTRSDRGRIAALREVDRPSSRQSKRDSRIYVALDEGHQSDLSQYERGVDRKAARKAGSRVGGPNSGRTSPMPAPSGEDETDFGPRTGGSSQTWQAHSGPSSRSGHSRQPSERDAKVEPFTRSITPTPSNPGAKVAPPPNRGRSASAGAAAALGLESNRLSGISLGGKAASEAGDDPGSSADYWSSFTRPDALPGQFPASPSGRTADLPSDESPARTPEVKPLLQPSAPPVLALNLSPTTSSFLDLDLRFDSDLGFGLDFSKLGEVDEDNVRTPMANPPQGSAMGPPSFSSFGSLGASEATNKSTLGKSHSSISSSTSVASTSTGSSRGEGQRRNGGKVALPPTLRLDRPFDEGMSVSTASSEFDTPTPIGRVNGTQVGNLGVNRVRGNSDATLSSDGRASMDGESETSHLRKEKDRDSLTSKWSPSGIKRRRSQGSMLNLFKGPGSKEGSSGIGPGMARRKDSTASVSSMSSYGPGSSADHTAPASVRQELTPPTTDTMTTSRNGRNKSLPPTPTSPSWSAASVQATSNGEFEMPQIGTRIKRGLSRLRSQTDLLSSFNNSSGDGSAGTSTTQLSLESQKERRAGKKSSMESTTSSKLLSVLPRPKSKSSAPPSHVRSRSGDEYDGFVNIDIDEAGGPANGLQPGSNDAPPRRRRRSSLSGLLDMATRKSASSHGHERPQATSAILDKRSKTDEPVRSKRTDSLDEARRPKPTAKGKKSEERRPDPAATAAKRPSTDDLLAMASAKLDRFRIEARGGDDSRRSSTLSTSTVSIDESGGSSPTAEDEDHAGEAELNVDGSGPAGTKTGEQFQLSVATRIQRARGDATPTHTHTVSQSSVGGVGGASNEPTAPYPRSDSPTLVRTMQILQNKSAFSRRGSSATLLDSFGRESPALHKRGQAPDSGIGSDATLPTIWMEIEDSHTSYAAASKADDNERSQVLTTVLTPFLKREESEVIGALKVDEALARRQRDILFLWLDTLVAELKAGRTPNRGATLEAVGGITESRFLSATAFQYDETGDQRFRTTLISILDFAIEKLNEKAIYANTLAWSGRMLALAFFRIEGVAPKLLRTLPSVKRPGLVRIMKEANCEEKNVPKPRYRLFPEHLAELCFRDLRSYLTLLSPLPPSKDPVHLVKTESVAIEMTGNWLIRWTASDSDLPFAFYRAYHRQLAIYLQPTVAGSSQLIHWRPKDLLTAPGFLFVAASLLEKCDSLIHRNLRSVTTMGPNSNNFNASDSATLSMGAKPKVLEVTNRRLVSTFLDIVGCLPTSPTDTTSMLAPEAQERRRLFGGILSVMLAAVVKRTSLWDTRGVFVLLDFVEGLIFTVCNPVLDAENQDPARSKPPLRDLELFDVRFIFGFVKIIVTKADNTVCLMRAIAFLYSLFDIFTTRPGDRHELCDLIILDREIFEHLFLHFNAGVRGYFLRLLVWRLSRLGTGPDGRPLPNPDPAAVAVLQSLNTRLEVVRKRHDELEPLDQLATEEAETFRQKRSTICSTRGVTDQPWIVPELSQHDVEVASDEGHESLSPVEVADRKLNGLPLSDGPPGSKDNAGVSKVVSWLKLTLNSKKKQQHRAAASRIDPFPFHSPPRGGSDDDEAFTEMTGRSSAESATKGATTSPPTSPPRSPPARAASKRDSLEPPDSPSFFQFEFEVDTPRSDHFDTPPGAPAAPASSPAPPGPTSPANARRRSHRPASSTPVSPRVSLRFSKRASILPAPALDMLADAHAVPIPPLPEQYRPQAYESRLHPYAVRALFEYESALDEYDLWKLRIDEDEDGEAEGKTLAEMIPRLGVAWPNIFDSD